MENIWLWIWIGFGLIGEAIARRKPNKFLFDDQMKLTIYLVLKGFWVQVWGAGPIYLVYVLLAPEKQICNNCRRVIGSEEIICPFCLKQLEPSISENDKVTDWQKSQQISDPALAKGNNKYMLVSLVLFLILTPLLTMFWGYIFSTINDWRLSAYKPIQHKLVLEYGIWVVVGIFTAIISSALPVSWGVRLIFGDKVDDYNNFQNQIYPGTSKALGRNLLIGFVAIISLFIVLMMDWYFVACPDRVVINNFLELGETTYFYTEIVSIKSSKQIEEKKLSHSIYVIDFANGDRWSSNGEIRDSYSAIDELVNYISAESNVPVNIIPSFTNADIN